MNDDDGIHTMIGPSNYTVWNASSILLRPKYVSKLTRLVVFLPGTGATPSKYRKLLESAQSAGHFVIGLSYLSQPFPVSQANVLCTKEDISNPTLCNSELHERMLFGSAPINLEGASKNAWNVVPDHSIVALLNKTLNHVEWGNMFLKYNTQSASKEVAWQN